MSEDAVTAVLTCQLCTDDGRTVRQCDRTDYEEVEMRDGGTVRLCPKHRGWAAAMGVRQTYGRDVVS